MIGGIALGFLGSLTLPSTSISEGGPEPCL
jgi:hypothetical protein